MANAEVQNDISIQIFLELWFEFDKIVMKSVQVKLLEKFTWDHQHY